MVELENENRVLVHDIELSNGMEVMVDAGTGVVLYTEVDSDGEDEVEDWNDQKDANTKSPSFLITWLISYVIIFIFEKITFFYCIFS